MKYISCICGDGRGTFAASEFLLSPLSMVYLIYGFDLNLGGSTDIKP